MIHIIEWSWGQQAGDASTYQWNIHDPVKGHILNAIERSPYRYTYQTAAQLMFELEMRKQIMRAARDLNYSGADFTTFQTARCNPMYWQLTPQGGFRLKPHVSPSAAIHDIYTNGRAYGFECATAIIIVFYKAALESIGVQDFDQLFRNLYLYSWEVDQDLGMYTLGRTDFIPGDAMYVKNPDVNPAEMEYQGENIIDLGDGSYYGHGIGVTTIEEIVAVLNRHRKPGSTASAYLLDQTTRPNFLYLSAFAKNISNRNITAKLGTSITLHG